jgi:hypothetical protein
MEVQEGLGVQEVELLLNGVNVKIEVLEEGTANVENPFPGYHVRKLLCYIDGKLCRVTSRTSKQNEHGN